MLVFLRQSSNFLNKQLIRPGGCRFYQVPIFLENGEGEMGYDIYSRLLQSRIVCLFGPVTDELTSAVVSQLLFLQFQNSKEPIHMYINSIGGLVQSGLAIYDTMQCISPPVATLCVGQAISMGAFLLAAGAPGMRKALPHTTIMIHQPVSKFRKQWKETHSSLLWKPKNLGSSTKYNKMLPQSYELVQPIPSILRMH
uniref:ATP-dependent Clp protease proteolytic subunit n=1 Tax=Crassostrea virginica TaxID=6565 RepID=A0A8B8CNT9_CRAVI|nr:uncharacterized protein LOC111119835 isoform X2 [Crassostrea virginica]